MKGISKTIQRLAATLLLLGVVAAGYGYLWYSISSTHAKIITLENEIAEAALADQGALEAETLLRNLQDAEKLLTRSFLTDDTLVPFLEQIEGLDALSGGTVTVLSVNGEGQAYKLSVSAEGSWTNVYHVFELIEALPVAVSVSNVRFTRQGGVAAPWQAIFDFTVAQQSS